MGKRTERARSALNAMIRGTASMLIVTIAAACTREDTMSLPPKIYQAHGSTWTYRQTVIQTRNPWLAPLHAGGNGYREHHLIENERGERIVVEDRLYALQRNGRYKKVRCCEYFREQAELFSFDGRLVLQFENAREFITDCFIYPAGIPDNERKPEAEQVFGSTVYAVFDPQLKIFRVDTFDPGRRGPPASDARQSIEENAYAAFENRAPFACST